MPASRASEDGFSAVAPVNEAKMVWGPFHVGGYMGILVNALACAYLVLILFFVIWPPATPATAPTMNYAIVMFSGVALLATVYYMVWARKTYEGPVVETNVS